MPAGAAAVVKVLQCNFNFFCKISKPAFNEAGSLLYEYFHRLYFFIF